MPSDTARNSDTFNTPHHKNETEAIASARRFLRLGFVVYSIKDATGTEMMHETAINERLSPDPISRPTYF